MALRAHFLRRALALWAAARLAVVVLGVLAGTADGGAPLALAPPAAALMVPLGVALGLADVARRGERALLGNFGVSRARLLRWLALPALAGEVAVATLLAAAR